MLRRREEIITWMEGRRAGTSGVRPADLQKRVEDILLRVRTEGDLAVRELTKEMDGVDIQTFAQDVRIGPDWKDDPLYTSLCDAASRIRRVCLALLPEREVVLRERGYDITVRNIPYERVGIYAPGGGRGYPSSVLMCGIPARVAGVKDIVLCTPNAGRGVMMAASLIGVDRLYAVGGAQAVAAMVYGTESIPRVEKVVGPGNVYVTEAKRLLRDTAGIDMLAGPSEVVLIADAAQDPEVIALDMLAQAEHGPGGAALCITFKEGFAGDVGRAVKRLLSRERRVWFRENVALAVVRDIDEAVDIVNELAPEHVSLLTEDAEHVSKRVVRAGTVCVGPGSATAFADYSSGLNHVLPTGGGAAVRGALSPGDFMRRVQYLRVSDPGDLVGPGRILAREEGFTFHERSMERRAGGG